MSSWNLCDKKLTLNNCFNAAKPSFKSLQCTAGGQRLAVDVCAVWPAAALKHGHIEAKTEDGVRADHMEAVLVFYCINQGWSLHLLYQNSLLVGVPWCVLRSTLLDFTHFAQIWSKLIHGQDCCKLAGKMVTFTVQSMMVDLLSPCWCWSHSITVNVTNNHKQCQRKNAIGQLQWSSWSNTTCDAAGTTPTRWYDE